MTTPLPGGWESQVLAGIGAPAGASDVQLLDAWQAAEGGSTNNPDAYNPFNTTRNTDTAGQALGGVPTNSVGVRSFPSWGAGLAATVATLEQPNMAAIRSDLVAGAPVATTEAAVAASPWGTGPFDVSGHAATLTSAPGGMWDPLNWGIAGGAAGVASGAAGGVISDALGSVARALYATVIKGGVVLMGAGLIVLAGYTLARQRAPEPSQEAASVLPLLAAAA